MMKQLFPGTESCNEIDASGLACPMPLLKAKLALNTMCDGELLRLIATDPGSERDVQSFCQLAKHRLEAFNKYEDKFIYHIRKGATEDN